MSALRYLLVVLMLCVVISYFGALGGFALEHQRFPVGGGEVLNWAFGLD